MANCQKVFLSARLARLSVELQSPPNTVIPAQAGIQTEDVSPVFLDSRFRGNDDSLRLSLPILHFAVLPIGVLQFTDFSARLTRCGGLKPRRGMRMNKQFSIAWFVLFSLAITVPISNAEEPERPQRVSTSVGIFDVQSPEEIHRFSASEIRELVRLENGRHQGEGTVPHPVLVYAFEERTFNYTGGRYQDAEIRYRLHTPRTIRPGRRYPLIVHLHGAGESGSNNTSQLVHLHSILPVLIGPEREDFFMLVTQCPDEDRSWSFRPAQDGNLDVLMAILEQVILENPIDTRRITVTGVSSGGWGVWNLLLRHPDKFAGAVPTACGAPPPSRQLEALTRTPIWAINNRGDVDPASVLAAMRVINGEGGSMVLTETSASGHNAWRPAMEDYNCFRWMLAQRKGSWLAPPPGVIVRSTPRSPLLAFAMYIVPLGIIVCIIFLSWETVCEQVSEISQAVRERMGKG